MAAVVVQSKSVTGTSNPDFVATFDSSTTVGNTIVVYAWINDPGATSCADNKSNSYTAHTSNPQGSHVAGDQNPRISAFYVRNISGGATHTVTATMGGNASGGIMIAEVSGLDNSATVQEANNSGNGAALTAGSVTMIGAGAVFGGAAINEFADLTASGSWVLEENNRIFPSGALLSQIVPSGGAYNPTGTWEASNLWGGLTFGFEEASTNYDPIKDARAKVWRPEQL